jgi:hypothetical protein
LCELHYGQIACSNSFQCVHFKSSIHVDVHIFMDASKEQIRECVSASVNDIMCGKYDKLQNHQNQYKWDNETSYLRDIFILWAVRKWYVHDMVKMINVALMRNWVKAISVVKSIAAVPKVEKCTVHQFQTVSADQLTWCVPETESTNGQKNYLCYLHVSGQMRLQNGHPCEQHLKMHSKRNQLELRMRIQWKELMSMSRRSWDINNFSLSSCWLKFQASVIVAWIDVLVCSGYDVSTFPSSSLGMRQKGQGHLHLVLHINAITHL